MKNLKIATWNIKNSYANFDKNNNKTLAVVDLLEKEDLDILALQEVNPYLLSKIEEKLKEKGIYKIVGDYPKIKNPISNIRIENNILILKAENTGYSVKKELPFMPSKINLDTLLSIRKRDVDINNISLSSNSSSRSESVTVYNTHLDHSDPSLGRKQMDTIYNVIEEQKRNPKQETILVGNLNRMPSEDNMIWFRKKLEELGMKIIDNPSKTYIGHSKNEPVDYIVVPENYIIESVKNLTEYESVSSHYPVVADVRRR